MSEESRRERESVCKISFFREVKENFFQNLEFREENENFFFKILTFENISRNENSILRAQNVVSEGIPIVYVYQMHQQNGSFAQNVDSEEIPGSTNGVNKKARNNKLYGDRAPPTSTNVLIYKMGWPPRLQFLAPFHISCNPDINKVGNRSYMGGVGVDVDL